MLNACIHLTYYPLSELHIFMLRILLDPHSRYKDEEDQHSLQEHTLSYRTLTLLLNMDDAYISELHNEHFDQFIKAF